MFKGRILLAVLICLSSFYSAQPEIIEIKAIDAIHQHVDSKDVFLVFDIDNVVAHPTGGVGGYGSDEWWLTKLEAEVARGVSHKDAVTLHLDKAMMTVDLKLVEERVGEIIKHFQNQNIPTIALTARSCHFAERTKQQLAALNVDFAKTALTSKLQDPWLPNDTQYHNGMFFCGFNDKGEALIKLLAAAQHVPAKVVFIDDKLKNLVSVEAAMQKLKIPFIGLRYGYLDQEVEAFKNKKNN